MLKNGVSVDVVTRRQNLIRDLGPDADQTLVIFHSGAPKLRTRTMFYPFRPEANFYYLTECAQSDVILVMFEGKSHLFLPPVVEEKVIWDGEHHGPEHAQSVYQCDEGHDRKSFGEWIKSAMHRASRVAWDWQSHTDLTLEIQSALRQANVSRGTGQYGLRTLIDPTPLVARLRKQKSPFEIEIMRKAAQATVAAHRQALIAAISGRTEKQLEGDFFRSGLEHGATGWAYDPIIASGHSATVLHYHDNNQVLRDGDLVLIDAAFELDHWCSDVTSTFPVSGKFTEAQRVVYEALLEINKKCQAFVMPEKSYLDVHDYAVGLTIDALVDLGELTGSRDEIKEKGLFRPYFPHGVGHYLGLEVHDVGLYSSAAGREPLGENAVITIEPGLYFRDSSSRFYGIGVRVEDDVRITPQGADCLSQGLPRTVKDIEAYCRNR